MNKTNVNICPMYPDVDIPVYQTDGSAGCDIKAYIKNSSGEPTQLWVNHGCTGEMIPTGLKVAIPSGFYLAVVPRSGLSIKTKIRISNSPGTIDSDYRNEIKIIVDNIGQHENDDICIKHGDRIAQLILLPYHQANFNIVEDLDETTRKGGFGSTGMN